MFNLDCVDYAVEQWVLLHPVSLTFEPGHVYGLIGHNGSGKSTLLKLLARQIQPTHGHMMIDERALSTFSARVNYDVPYVQGLSLQAGVRYNSDMMLNAANSTRLGVTRLHLSQP